MEDRKIWFTPEVNSILKKLDGKCDTYHMARYINVYTIINAILKLSDDIDKCTNPRSKELLRLEIDRLSYDIKNYRVYDSRYEDVFDEGK